MISKLIAFLILILSISPAALAADSDINQQFKNDYAKIAFLNYSDAYKDAQVLHTKIVVFLQDPNETSFEAAKAAWLKSRISYGQSEVFRFYGGPIDFIDATRRIKGPETRLNSWPINESYIDYTEDNPHSGIVNNLNIPIRKGSLSKAHQKNNKSQIYLGYHVIEFLLWGQDLSLRSSGRRPVSDYYRSDIKNNKRRRYLALASILLVDDLHFVMIQWQAGKRYARSFVKLDDKIAGKNVLTALEILGGSELALKRMKKIISNEKSKKNELSPFSDNTHNDFIYNQQGIKNIFLGDYKNFQGVGIYELLTVKNPELADKILAHIDETANLIAQIDHPIDAKVVNTKTDSESRAKMKEAISSLQEQTKLFLQAEIELVGRSSALKGLKP